MSATVLKKRPSLREYEVFVAAEGKDHTKEVLSRSVPWAKYKDSDYLTEAELGLLLDYDKHTPEEQSDMLSEQGEAYAALFVKALTTIAVEESVEYLLVLVEQMLTADPERCAYFAGLDSPYKPFMGILRRYEYKGHDFAVAKASSVLGLLVGTNGLREGDEDAADFLSWLSRRLDAAEGPELIVVVSALKAALRGAKAQLAFVHEYAGLRSLTGVLRRSSQNTQLLYTAVFSVWLLSFNKDLHNELHDADIVSRLVEVIQANLREKLVRVVFGTFLNFLEHEKLTEAMAVSQLLRMLPMLKSRKWEDADVVESLDRVDETLKQFVRKLSSIDKYLAELETGSLHWSPVHNEKFFRQNIAAFEEGQFKRALELFALLDSEDEITLEVACYDIGEFARIHPDGRRVVSKSGAKDKLMALMSHKEPKVAKSALLSVQKLMVSNWQQI